MLNRQSRFVAKFVNGVHVVLDTHTLHHIGPFGLQRLANERAATLNARPRSRGQYGGQR